ncbi:hypothetical protein [Agrococcus sp. SGAir0287]|uniref:hypothetical protein n=1 Tax=Agrococcus sp. SGAir0287 TaxID=2070347 RepID=UPI0010CD5DC7|nr:hypothetical protein [Agrococcus sp. SGAir0287]QCR19982.1 hypothetical protein C1N71_11505 [Agrococcus sp. SGAir0287]
MTQPPPPQPPSWSQPQQQSVGAAPRPLQPPLDPAPRRRANVLGIAAIAVAALLTLTAPAQQLAVNLAISQGGGVPTIEPLSNAFTAVRVVLSLMTIGLAIAGLVVRDRRRLLAAAALGIGVSVLVQILLSVGVGFVASSL